MKLKIKYCFSSLSLQSSCCEEVSVVNKFHKINTNMLIWNVDTATRPQKGEQNKYMKEG